jgi:hypothetical protein
MAIDAISDGDLRFVHRTGVNASDNRHLDLTNLAERNRQLDPVGTSPVQYPV